VTTLNLRALAHDEQASIDDIGEALDQLTFDAARDAAFSLRRADQRALFHKARRQVSLDDFVPAERAPLEPVRHYGRNTLPLPTAFKHFEKRFCRPEDGTIRLFGYNEGTSRPWIGPGYFVARPTSSEPTWHDRGAIVVDYFQVPDGPVADGWPTVVPNTNGLQRFVFHRTRDFMRKVSRHVAIGAAYKVEKALDHYFILVREA
jgi:hypothetical protein